MIVSNLKALEGLVWGTALGDGLYCMSRFRNPPFLLHSAIGTWFLSIFQSVFGSGDLSLKLQILTSPSQGLALRGAPSSLATTLQEAATKHPTHKLLADLLPCLTPLVFLPKEANLAQQIINYTHVTHWHPRVVSSAALLVGSLRALCFESDLSLEQQLEAGEQLADKVLQLLFEKKEADTPQVIRSAHQALHHYVALAKGTPDFHDLQIPLGFDGRDSPEQLVVYALALTHATNPVQEDLNCVLEQCGSPNLLAPLVGGVAGFRQGLSALPEAKLKMLWGQELWKQHLDFHFPCLAEAEIKLSLAESVALKELDHFQGYLAARNQLSLFEN